jgi:hypothetical protein
MCICISLLVVCLALLFRCNWTYNDYLSQKEQLVQELDSAMNNLTESVNLKQYNITSISSFKDQVFYLNTTSRKWVPFHHHASYFFPDKVKQISDVKHSQNNVAILVVLLGGIEFIIGAIIFIECQDSKPSTRYFMCFRDHHPPIHSTYHKWRSEVVHQYRQLQLDNITKIPHVITTIIIDYTRSKTVDIQSTNSTPVAKRLLSRRKRRKTKRLHLKQNIAS